MVVAGNTPTASFLTKIGKMQSAGCRLCKIAREARGERTDGLADETHGHINSAGCEGMATTVTAAHHSIWRHLYDSMHAAQKPKSKLKFVTLDKESNMSTLWRREEFLRICSVPAGTVCGQQPPCDTFVHATSLLRVSLALIRCLLAVFGLTSICQDLSRLESNLFAVYLFLINCC